MPEDQNKSASGIITKEMSIGEVVNKYPGTAEVFMDHGLHCVGCMVAAYENIRQGAEAHGLDVEKLVDDLNKKVAEDKASGQK